MLYPKLRGADIMRKINLKTIKIYFLVLFLLFFLVTSSVFSTENKKDLYSLEDISNIRQFHFSPATSEFLRKNSEKGSWNGDKT